VLDLAVRGWLVEPDPSDQPAVRLLDEMADRRKALLADRTISQPRHPVGVAVDAPPHEIPPGWVWARLGDISAIVGGGTPKSDEPRYWSDGQDIPWLTPADMRSQETRLVVRGARDITPAGLANSSAQLLPAGSVLFSSRAPIGHVGIAAQPLATNQGFKSCVPYEPLMAKYVHLFLRQVAPSVEAAATGTTFKEVSGKDVSLIPIPVPPLPEQERIVAKADEILRFLDDFDARRERRRQAITQFRASALGALGGAASRDDLRKAWLRIDHNWETVTADVASASALRPALLQLAVEGRLVSRSAAEGTGDDALEQALLQRSELAKTGAIAEPKERLRVEPDDAPFDLPIHWNWVRVEDVMTHVVDCLHRTPTYKSSGYPAIRTCDVEPGRVLVDQALRVDELTFLEQSRRLTPLPGDVLYSREGGRFGIAAVVPVGTQLCLSQRMMQFRCAEAIVPEYFAWFLNAPLGFRQASDDVGGSASPHVNIRSIRRFLMPLPPTGEQRRIVTEVERMLDQIDQLGIAIVARESAATRLGAALSSFLVA